jgi:hypothetical protein
MSLHDPEATLTIPTAASQIGDKVRPVRFEQSPVGPPLVLRDGQYCRGALVALEASIIDAFNTHSNRFSEPYRRLVLRRLRKDSLNCEFEEAKFQRGGH